MTTALGKLVAGNLGSDWFNKFNSLYDQQTADEALIAANTAAIQALVQKQSGMLGGYAQPTSGPTYGSTSQVWNKIAGQTELTFPASSAIQTYGVLPAFQLPMTVNGLPVWVALSSNVNVNSYTTIVVNTFTMSNSVPAVVTKLASTTSGSGSFPSVSTLRLVAILGSNSFRIESSTTSPAVYDITISNSGTASFTSVGTGELWEASAPTYVVNQQNPLVTQVGSGSEIVFDYVGTTDLLPFMRVQNRSTAGVISVGSGKRLCSFKNTIGACPLGWAPLGGGYFLVATLIKQVSGSIRTGFYLIYADDNGPVPLQEFSFPTVPTSIKVSAMSNSLVIVKIAGSSTSLVVPLTINTAAKPPVAYAMNASNQSSQSVSSGGFGLPMLDAAPWSALYTFMLTKESGNNAFALRPVYFDSTQAANPALYETSAGPITYSQGAGIDTTNGGFVQNGVTRAGTERLVIVGCSSANGATANALSILVLDMGQQ